MTIIEAFIRCKNKFLYNFGVRFPFSKVRVKALRHLGYSVGNDVYFPSDLTITFNYVYHRGELIIGDRVAIDVILIPCVGFDREGHRTGHGAGYYDRFLQKSSNALKVLVAFDAQECKELLACETTDHSVDVIVTESGIRWLKAKSGA